MLNAFFQVSVSVFCVVATVFMLTLFVWAIMLHAQLGKLIKKLEEILEVVKTTAGEAKDFTERTIQSLETFKNSIFTFEFIRKIATEVIELVKNNRKGTKDGQAE